MPASKKSPSLIGTLSIVTLFILFLSLLGNTFFLKQNYDRTIVTKVIDGDSFELADGRRIRLLSVDAPEKDRCFYQESRDHLDSLLYGKNVDLKNIVTDDYGRQLANVYVDGQLVNLDMLNSGLVRFVYTQNPYYEDMKSATRKAKEHNLGIFSPQCRNKTAPADCLIKGNTKNGNIYHLPSCRSYKLVIVDESFGDHWFCTEQEALAAGFRKAKECSP